MAPLSRCRTLPFFFFDVWPFICGAWFSAVALIDFFFFISLVSRGTVLFFEVAVVRLFLPKIRLYLEAKLVSFFFFFVSGTKETFYKAVILCNVNTCKTHLVNPASGLMHTLE